MCELIGGGHARIKKEGGGAGVQIAQLKGF